MDGFADDMVARGPTFAADRTTWTGSLHIVDLPSVEAAYEFVEREPYNRAGLFEQHLIRRFENLLGRTMWQGPRMSDDPRFLAIGSARVPRRPAPAPERLIVHGELLTVAEGTPVGVALALQAPSRTAAAALAGVDLEFHDWEFGGRR
jgi:uncharacterized protein